jgi:hypothetical protein
MKINYWKAAAIGLAGVLFWLAYSSYSVSAQYGQGYRITRIYSLSGSLDVSGEVKGFSCVSDVSGSLDKGDGIISTDAQCYVLSKQ